MAANAKDCDCPPCLGDDLNVKAHAASIAQVGGVNPDITHDRIGILQPAHGSGDDQFVADMIVPTPGPGYLAEFSMGQ